MMNKKEMLEMVINHYEDGNKAQFAKRLGISPQALSMWFTRNSFDAELLYNKCDGLSGDWLLSGEGEMFKTSQKVNVGNEELNVEILKLRTENNLLREIVGLREKTNVG